MTEEVVVENNVEAEAARYGWVPKEKFRGNEEDWIDAETFVKKGREISPILRSNNERLKKELDALKQKLDATETSAKEFKKFQQQMVEAKVKEYENTIAQLKAQKKEAISNADGDLVVELDEQIEAAKEAQREAKKPVEETPQSTTTKPTPEFLAWKEENSWYDSDSEMTEEADLIGRALVAKGVTGKKLLDEVEKRVKKMFPEKFDPPKEVPRVAGSTGGVPKGAKKTYANLPDDAKAACDDFVSRGWMTQDEYVKSFDWS